MKIYEFSPFYNENMLLGIKAAEAANWIDEVHVVESNRTFRFGEKPYNFAVDHPRVHHHKLDGTAAFKGATHWGISRRPPFWRRKDSARTNETIQRNTVHDYIDPSDDDIVILSDIDEILDSSRADFLVNQVKKHGIISVRLHHTMFFLNLYSENWHELWAGAPADYAYRTFLMTGKVFRELPYSSDRLRRLGEWGKHTGRIHLPADFLGFHHSWLGDAHAVKAKLLSYAHALSDHSEAIVDETTGKVSLENLKALVESKQSIFDGHDLVVRDLEDQPLLPSIMSDLENYKMLLLSKETE